MRRVLQAYSDEGGIKDAPLRRRPQGTAYDEDRQLVAAVSVGPFQSAREVRDDAVIDVFTRTLQRRFAEAGMESRMAAKKPLLGESKEWVPFRFVKDSG